MKAGIESGRIQAEPRVSGVGVSTTWMVPSSAASARARRRKPGPNSSPEASALA